MMPIKWSKIDRFGLAYYVNREARDLLPLALNLLDLQKEGEGNRKVAESIYTALLAKDVQYALEPRTSSKARATQDIRVPNEVLETLKEGTCLDLALLFSGLCLAYELIPVLIILEGHALVAISLTHSSRSWDHREIYEDCLFKNALVAEENAEQLRDLITSGAYLVIESTGFARSHSLSDAYPEGIGRDHDGTMPFERAVAAGNEQLAPAYRRPFKFALDIAVAHYFYEMQPIAISGAMGRAASYPLRNAALQVDDNAGPLPYLLDRSIQEKELRKGALNHRAVAPRRPLVCLIHGDQYECHGEFVLRLREVSVPGILEYWHTGEKYKTPIMKYRVTLPSFMDVSAAAWEEMFWEELAKATVKGSLAAHTEVINFISGHKLAVIIEIPILAERLQGAPLDRIASILEFWASWPEIPEGLLVVICLSFKYQGKYEMKKEWYSRLLRSKGLNDRIREYLAGDVYRHKNFASVCLPELRGITQSEAEEAVNNQIVSRFYGLTERDIRGIYDRTDLCTSDGTIPMDTLLGELMRISGRSRLGEKYVE